ncbi:MAG: ATP-dependent DNA helicase RecG [Nitritalea sp.]
MSRFFEQHIEYLKGVGPQRAALLEKELQIRTFGDLLQHYPFRYEDRTQFYKVADLQEGMETVQLILRLRPAQTVGEARKKRLVVQAYDETGVLELTWFKGLQWVLKYLQAEVPYVVVGKPARYGRQFSIAHPEMELLSEARQRGNAFTPVYATTEKLRARNLDPRGIGKLLQQVIPLAIPHLRETLPEALLKEHRLMPKAEAIRQIHLPEDQDSLQRARFRLKFEEFFFVQIRLLLLKLTNRERSPGLRLGSTHLVSTFYAEKIPFDLTGAQKRVIREAFEDMRSGQQMNRLIQGDVGSGKTMVAFICALIAIGSGAQVCLMAPTEILAQQHYEGLKGFAASMGLELALLTGSTRKAQRRVIHEALLDGSLKLLIGTHALLEDVVRFQNLGLAIVDEQHRFGVAQRAKLWAKNERAFPHVLVMTATPIPRTLAMTLYGDLDVSLIDELPAGRKPIQTVHRYEKDRLTIFSFLRKQIEEGRQVYIVYPLIEESETLELNNLMEGFESICRAFPEYPVSIVHGNQKPADKEFEMQRFVKGETKIMVATTVIEVGVNVPNASVMVIENAERFGLSQLHQLRGRVGRGAAQSFCILITKYALSKDSKVRIETMVRTNDGFEIAEVDLKLRGPGDLMGTQQSGVADLIIADLARDGAILQLARQAAERILQTDPSLALPENARILTQIRAQGKHQLNWSRIS